MITVKPARTVTVYYNEMAWTYIKFQHKISPDYEITIENIDVVHEDNTPVEIQMYIKARPRGGRGSKFAKRLYFRTQDHEPKKSLWRHAFDPLGSSTVGPNSKTNPIVCKKIEIGESDT